MELKVGMRFRHKVYNSIKEIVRISGSTVHYTYIEYPNHPYDVGRSYTMTYGLFCSNSSHELLKGSDTELYRVLYGS